MDSTGIPKPRRNWLSRVVLPAGLAAGLLALVAYTAGDSLLPKRRVSVIPVVVRIGTSPSGTLAAQAPGWVEPDPYPIGVSALADGILKEVPVLEGSPVEIGQVVARLVDDDARLALARADGALALKRAELEIAEAALKAAQTDWDFPIERTRALHTAEAMLQETAAELARIPAEITVESALLVELQAEFERVQQVFATQSAADIELVRARQRYEVQRSKVQMSEGRKPILEAKVRQLEAEVTAARENLRLRILERRTLAEARAKVAQAAADVRQSEAAREEAALRLSRMDIRSPAAGVVQSRLIEPGAKLVMSMDDPRSAQAFRLYDPQKLQVRVDIPLADAAKVGVGQQARIVVDVLPDRTFDGTVTRMVHEADLQKNTIQVKVAIKDPVAELKPEMLARVKFLSAATSEVAPTTQRLYAPERWIDRREGKAAAWVADISRGVAVRRSITLGDGRVRDWIEVLDGLRAGDRLIAEDPATLKDGLRIAVVGEAAAEPGP